MRRPTIFYFCPDFRLPVGGVKVMYRHVDILNKNGLSASVLHSRTGFRCHWFRNQTNIEYITRLDLGKDDFIVFPESLLAYFTDSHNPSKLLLRINRLFAKNRHKYYLHELSKAPARKVIFNQGVYLTFEGFDYSKDYEIPYLHTDVVGTICVSENNFDYLRYIFPDLNLYRVRLSAGSADFYYQSEKKRQIALMANRNKEDVNQVLNILKIKKIADGFQLAAIKDKTENQVSQILRESLIFLSFGKAEGFSLPPMEAMLCGCVVIGYHGRGGREYFHPEFSYSVEAGDIIGFAQKIEEVISTYEANPSFILDKGKKASEYISLNYSTQNEEADLVKTWTEILKLYART